MSTIQVDYIDGKQEIFDCTFFGTLAEMPEFLGFSNQAPDDMEEMPFKSIRSSHIVKIEIIKTRDVAK